MPTAVKWKIKPLIICIALVILILINTVFYSRKFLLSLISPIHEEKRQNLLIKWDEPNGVYKREDPGEYGQAVKYGVKEQGEVNKAYSEYGFNQHVSDKISLHRSLPDPRPFKCKAKLYDQTLPKVSVIIIFYNEGWSTLLRTLHSVLDRSPPELLHEIVLCDDASPKVHLKSKLEVYASKLPKVKLVRTKQREGLIRARVYGADHASGEVLLFLDSHCECNIGWLPPLLSEIKKDYRTVVCPTVDFIDHGDFHYRGVDPYIRGTFNWRFDYKERGITEEQKINRQDDTEGVKSPVMAGGLFAISQKFWEELGKYDPGMYVWGGEQYEISFKLWMCGGKMLNMPCSRVGHVYRRNVPYSYDKPNAVLINFKRVAEVWMDGFKEFLYQRRPDIRHQKHGNIVDRMAIRNRNKCKSFKWYLQHVANDTIRTKYEPDRGVGQIIHVQSNMCLDTMYRSSGEVISLKNCGSSASQQFRWTFINELRQEPEECLDARYADQENVYVEKCHEMGGNQKFKYNAFTSQFFHEGTGYCLSAPDELNPRHPVIEGCQSNSKSQKWKMKLNDVNQPAPEWAKIAEDLDRPPVP